jgi:GTPase SAR1 family protein
MLIIIIGLPASGKTTYYNTYLKNDYILFDDFINNFYDNELIDAIKNNMNICAIDPRLCNYSTFTEFITIFQEYISKDNIKLILFPNNKNNCIDNAIKRNTIKVNRTIEYLSTIYDISNYYDYKYVLI